MQHIPQSKQPAILKTRSCNKICLLLLKTSSAKNIYDLFARIINVLFYYDRCFGESAVGYKQYAEILFVGDGHGHTEKNVCEKTYVACVGRVTGYHNTSLKALDSSSGLDTKTRTGHINVLSLGISISPDANSEWSYLENRKKTIYPYTLLSTHECVLAIQSGLIL